MRLGQALDTTATTTLNPERTPTEAGGGRRSCLTVPRRNLVGTRADFATTDPV